jgi:hypothetical protein
MALSAVDDGGHVEQDPARGRIRPQDLFEQDAVRPPTSAIVCTSEKS